MKTAPAGRLHPGFQPETRQYLVNELGRSHDPRSRGVGDRIFANLCFLADEDTPQRVWPPRLRMPQVVTRRGQAVRAVEQGQRALGDMRRHPRAVG